jgi:hypothetical protein
MASALVGAVPTAAQAAPAAGRDGWFCVWPGANYTSNFPDDDCGRQLAFDVPYKVLSWANHTHQVWSIRWLINGAEVECLTQAPDVDAPGPYSGPGVTTRITPGSCF